MTATVEIDVCKIKYIVKPSCPKRYDLVKNTCILQCKINNENPEELKFLVNKEIVYRRFTKYFLRDKKDGKCYESCKDLFGN
jgi:hypothetical protein